MTAVSAICLLWVCYLVFKDRAACFRLSCCATVSLSLTAFNRRGGCCILNRFRCQAAVAASLFRFTAKESCSSLSWGRGTYCLSALRVNSLRRLDFPRPPLLVACATSSAEGRRLLPPPRFESTRFVDFLFRSVLLRSAGGSHRQCGFAFHPRGRGFYRLVPRESTTFVDFLFPARRCCRLRDIFGLGEAASTTAAS